MRIEAAAAVQAAEVAPMIVEFCSSDSAIAAQLRGHLREVVAPAWAASDYVDPHAFMTSGFFGDLMPAGMSVDTVLTALEEDPPELEAFQQQCGARAIAADEFIIADVRRMYGDALRCGIQQATGQDPCVQSNSLKR